MDVVEMGELAVLLMVVLKLLDLQGALEVLLFTLMQPVL
jgi:hypothetical protein